MFSKFKRWVAFFLIVLSGVFFINNYVPYGYAEPYSGEQKLYTAVPPVGKTGAPGEGSCMQCHGGEAFSGDGFNTINFSGDSNMYAVDSVYTIHVSMNTLATKNGFQMVALKNSDQTSAGNWIVTDPVNTQISAFRDRKYMNHTTSGTSTNSWTFKWKAPSSSEGIITFYLATNETNNQGNTFGDKIYLSQFSIATNEPEMEEELPLINGVSFYQSATNRLTVNFTTFERAYLYFQLLDVTGQLIYDASWGYYQQGSHNRDITLIDIRKGVYIAHLFMDNRVTSQKIRLK